jgi:L-glyceraldehyde 3-phosphate reductase
MLTDRYLKGIPADSRAGKPHGFLRPEHVTDDKLEKVRRLSVVAQQRGQSMAQMAVSWILRLKGVTSVLIGASRVGHIEEAVGALDHVEFQTDELATIEGILAG